MARRTKIRRSLRRARPQIRRSPAATARSETRRCQLGETGLVIGGAQDPAEKRADRIADRVMRLTAPAVHRKCDACEDGEKQTQEAPRKTEDGEVKPKAATTAASVAPAAAAAPASPGTAKAIGSLGSGRPLASAERAFFEPRFGADLSPVRVHEGRQADFANRAIDARAFALGDDIAFAKGEYAPGSDAGRRLMAHELAHVVESGDRIRAAVRRKTDAAESADPLCVKYEPATQRLFAELDVDALTRADDTEVRLSLIQSLKMIQRCGSDTDKTDVLDYMKTKLGEERALAIWKESTTTLGGYRGVYPGYYSGKRWLTKLGLTVAEAFSAFSYDPRSDDVAKYREGAKASASSMSKTIEHTDILYFYGHQYAQYNNPGAFANGSQTQFIDLRALAGRGDFGRVKLIISTSCATLCKEAIEVFAPLFPNAVILGYRKSAPIDGDAVRQSFDKTINSLKKPLLLDQPVDVSAIVDVWKAVVKSIHGRESERLPGYYQSGTVHYLENGSWASLPATDEANSCRKKGSEIEEATH
jgi:hypothetical protein